MQMDRRLMAAASNASEAAKKLMLDGANVNGNDREVNEILDLFCDGCVIQLGALLVNLLALYLL